MTGEPLFLWVFDTAVNVAIDTFWQKYTFRQKSGVSGIVCREKVKRNKILWILAERYNILSANVVEKWGYDESWIQFGKTSYDLAKAGSLYQLYKVSPNDMRLKNIGKAQKI
jgi:hypothetical protein